MSAKTKRLIDFVLISNTNWKCLLDNFVRSETTLVVIFGINYKYYVLRFGLCGNLEIKTDQGPLLLTINYLPALRVRHSVLSVRIHYLILINVLQLDFSFRALIKIKTLYSWAFSNWSALRNTFPGTNYTYISTIPKLYQDEICLPIYVIIWSKQGSRRQ